MNELQDSWATYVQEFAQWTSFITLTFSDADRTHDVTRDEATYKWRRLVQVLNQEIFGNHYTRIVGHSYFAYALAYEYQKRGALHLHALTDRRVHWHRINYYWRHVAGIAMIKPVNDKDKVSRYLAKYVTKGGELSMYKPKVYKEPPFKPLWYLGI
jgi:hypothetical protein